MVSNFSSEFLKEAESLDKEDLLNSAKKYLQLFNAAHYICVLGTPIKPSRDFDRAHKRALKDLEVCLLRILGSDVESSLTEDQRKLDLQTAKEKAIRSAWLDES